MQWGAWAGVGMAAASPLALARIARSGMGVIAPAAGLAALQATLSGFEALPWRGSAGLAAQRPAELLLSPFNWDLLLRGHGAAAPSIFYEIGQAALGAAAEQAGAAEGPAEAGTHGGRTKAGMAVTGKPLEGRSLEEVLGGTAATVHALLGNQVSSLVFALSVKLRVPFSQSDIANWLVSSKNIFSWKASKSLCCDASVQCCPLPGGA